MKITMLRDAIGADDGIHIKPYYAGSEYDVPESLAKDFISIDAAKPVIAEYDNNPFDAKSEPKFTNKALPGAKKNKSLDKRAIKCD